MPASDKMLPPLPPGTRCGAESPQEAKMFSPETYTKLLENENEQLRLLNQQLQQKVKTLEGRVEIEREDPRDVSIREDFRIPLEQRSGFIQPVLVRLHVREGKRI